MGTIFYNREIQQISYDGLNGVVRFSGINANDSMSNTLTSSHMECILGVLVTHKGKYLFFCSESELIGTFEDIPIHRILKVRYIILERSGSSDETESILNLIESLRFYYTFEDVEEHFLWNGEMLRQFEKFAEKNKKNSPQGNSMNDTSPYMFKSTKKTDSSFRSPFITKSKLADPLPVCPTGLKSLLAGNMFCGYFETQTVRENGYLYFLKIQSKISIKKIGTRMLSRGVDELGKVSFFVETKFVIKGDTERSEFTILRGSVPVYWSQDDPLKPHKINLEGDSESNRKAFKLHFDKLQRGYGKIIVVDLLGGKKYEKILSKMYRDLCEENGIDYMHFDFNKHVERFDNLKTMFYEKLAKTLNRIQQREGEGGEIKQWKIGKKIKDATKDLDLKGNSFINQSTGPVTHVSESDNITVPSDEGGPSSEDDMIGKEDEHIVDANDIWDEPDSSAFANEELHGDHKFKGMNVIFRVNCMDCLDRTNIAQFLLFNFSQKHKFKVIKSMWANNGNALSNMYTGSDALKSKLPVKGSISVLRKINDFVISANRMLNNRFTDKDKQQAIDLLLGKKSH